MSEFNKDSFAGQDADGYYNIAEPDAWEINYFDIRDLKRNLLKLKDKMVADPELYVVPDSPYDKSQSDDFEGEYYYSDAEVRVDTSIQGVWYALNEIATLSAIVDGSFAFKRTNDLVTSGYVKGRRAWEQISSHFGQYHWREWCTTFKGNKDYKRTKTLVRMKTDSGLKKIARLNSSGDRLILKLKTEGN